MKRKLMLEESKQKQLAAQAFRELESKTGKISLEEAYKHLLVQAKFQTFREIRYLEEEREMVRFERECPEEAQLAVAQHNFYNSRAAGTPKVVHLTPQDVDRIVKNNKKIPLDTVELLRI